MSPLKTSASSFRPYGVGERLWKFSPDFGTLKRYDSLIVMKFPITERTRSGKLPGLVETELELEIQVNWDFPLERSPTVSIPKPFTPLKESKELLLNPIFQFF